MRRFPTILFLACMFAVISGNNAVQAQTPPCDPDSCGGWNGPFSSVVNIGSCSSCIIIVTYYTRNACGQFDDFQITSMRILGCLSCPIQLTFQGVIREMLTQGLSGFPILGPGECADNWRIAAAPCWWYAPVPEGQDPLLTFCPAVGQACCMAQYLVCRPFADSPVTITTLAITGGPASCSSPCFPICDFLVINI